MKKSSVVFFLLMTQFVHAQIGVTGIGISTIGFNNVHIGVSDTLGMETQPTGGLCNRLLPCYVGLPVTMLPLEAKRLNKQTVQLHWETTSEINNVGFEIERSLGNTVQFVKMAFVKSAGSSVNAKKYEILDANDFVHQSYYRLKQVDKDGQYKYSNISIVQGQQEKAAAFVYPNPTHQLINISLTGLTTNGKIEIQLIDINGRIIQSNKIEQNPAHFYQLKLLPTLAKGGYFVKVITVDNVFIEKIMIV